MDGEQPQNQRSSRNHVSSREPPSTPRHRHPQSTNVHYNRTKVTSVHVSRKPNVQRFNDDTSAKATELGQNKRTASRKRHLPVKELTLLPSADSIALPEHCEDEDDDCISDDDDLAPEKRPRKTYRRRMFIAAFGKCLKIPAIPKKLAHLSVPLHIGRNLSHNAHVCRGFDGFTQVELFVRPLTKPKVVKQLQRGLYTKGLQLSKGPLPEVVFQTVCDDVLETGLKVTDSHGTIAHQKDIGAVDLKIAADPELLAPSLVTTATMKRRTTYDQLIYAELSSISAPARAVNSSDSEEHYSSEEDEQCGSEIEEHDTTTVPRLCSSQSIIRSKALLKGFPGIRTASNEGSHEGRPRHGIAPKATQPESGQRFYPQKAKAQDVTLSMIGRFPSRPQATIDVDGDITDNDIRK